MTTKTITRKQACNDKLCPACKSKDIIYLDTDCLCHCQPPCWSYPVCNNCGFTAGGGGGNSQGGIWITFAELGAAKKYEINVK